MSQSAQLLGIVNDTVSGYITKMQNFNEADLRNTKKISPFIPVLRKEQYSLMRIQMLLCPSSSDHHTTEPRSSFLGPTHLLSGQLCILIELN